MMRSVFASFFLLTAATGMAHSQAYDPFAALFGEEDRMIDAGLASAPGRDDIELVQVRLNSFTLIETQTAFQTSNGLCLPVEPLLEALEVPITLDGDHARGWFIDPARKIELDFTAGAGTVEGATFSAKPQKTEQGWCLPLADWSRILPVDFDYNYGALSVALTPREILPIEARLERDLLRQQIREDGVYDPNYPLIEVPYRWLSLPTADLNLGFQLMDTGQTSTEGSVELAGDILKMTGRLQYSGQNRPRITLGRVSAEAEELGPLKAHSFAIGDVVSTRLPMLAETRTGQGITISNRPTISADIFDTTDIRGALPQGWEAELYEGQQLLGFVTEADINGDYVFSDVALRPGYNRFTVKLFGPYGEREDRQVKIMVGAELCPENEVQYSFGLVRADKDEGALVPKRQVSAYTSLRYGLSKNTTGQLDAIVSDSAGFTAAGASLSGSAFNTYGVLRVASDGRGRPAYAAAIQKRLNDQGARLQLDVRDYGSVENEVSGFGDLRLQRSALLTYDTSINFGLMRGPTAMHARYEWLSLVNGGEETNLSSRFAGALGRSRWSNTVRYTNRTDKTGVSSSDLLGDFLVSRSFGDVRLRGAATYDLSETPEVTTLALAAQKRIGRKGFGQVTLSRDMKTSAMNLNASYSKSFDSFALSASAGADDKGMVTAGVRFSVSLFHDTSMGRYVTAAPGLSRSGAVRAVVFDDIDGDGVYGEVDKLQSDAGFIVGQSLRSERTSRRGDAVLGELQPGALTNIELKQSTIEDPFLQAAQPGAAVIARPGLVIDVPFALTATADIDGIVTMQAGSNATPVSGVTVEAVDEAGITLASTKTEYDGYYYIDGIAARSVTIRVAQEALNEISAQAAPVLVELSRDAPSAMGVDLSIRHAN
ncbi:MAG: hypothetical protein Hens3KO_12900 [Henriciella sp.]